MNINDKIALVFGQTLLQKMVAEHELEECKQIIKSFGEVNNVSKSNGATTQSDGEINIL